MYVLEVRLTEANNSVIALRVTAGMCRIAHCSADLFAASTLRSVTPCTWRVGHLNLQCPGEVSATINFSFLPGSDASHVYLLTSIHRRINVILASFMSPPPPACRHNQERHEKNHENPDHGPPQRCSDPPPRPVDVAGELQHEEDDEHRPEQPDTTASCFYSTHDPALLPINERKRMFSLSPENPRHNRFHHHLRFALYVHACRTMRSP